MTSSTATRLFLSFSLLSPIFVSSFVVPPNINSIHKSTDSLHKSHEQLDQEEKECILRWKAAQDFGGEETEEKWIFVNEEDSDGTSFTPSDSGPFPWEKVSEINKFWAGSCKAYEAYIKGEPYFQWETIADANQDDQDENEDDEDTFFLLPEVAAHLGAEVGEILQHHSTEGHEKQDHASSPQPIDHKNDEYDEENDIDDTPLPVIVWHGLGDDVKNEGLKETAKLIEMVHPSTYVYLISLSDVDDKATTFFGNVNDQIAQVCATIKKDKILSSAPAIDAVGFSQGGQFLRGLIERCGYSSASDPDGIKVRSFITFGSQHNGIAEFEKCKSATDWVCRSANALLKSSTVWSDFVQKKIVPAQYYRNARDYDNYLKYSNFLADINNERVAKNTSYADAMAELEHFVMVLFEEDNVVVPKESSWFAEVNITDSKSVANSAQQQQQIEDEAETKRIVTPLRNRTIYTEDWIGLKKLDAKKNGLVFESFRGNHMELVDKDLKRIFGKWFGKLRKDEKDGEDVAFTQDKDRWECDDEQVRTGKSEKKDTQKAKKTKEKEHKEEEEEGHVEESWKWDWDWEL